MFFQVLYSLMFTLHVLILYYNTPSNFTVEISWECEKCYNNFECNPVIYIFPVRIAAAIDPCMSLWQEEDIQLRGSLRVHDWSKLPLCTYHWLNPHYVTSFEESINISLSKKFQKHQAHLYCILLYILLFYKYNHSIIYF